MGKLLPNVELSKKEYGDLLFSKGIKGGEAKLVRDGNYIIKVFYKNFGYKKYSADCDEVGEIRENKFSKIKILSSLDSNVLGEIKPICTYTYNGRFVCYKMPYLIHPLLSDWRFSKEERLFYLSRMKETLLYLHDKGIIYGDVKKDNFFVNMSGGVVIPGDLDNMQVGNYSIDLMSGYARSFVDCYGCVDENLDSYMHNLCTLETFMECDLFGYDEVFDRIESNDVPSVISKDKVRKLVKVDSSYDLGYLIDDLEGDN